MMQIELASEKTQELPISNAKSYKLILDLKHMQISGIFPLFHLTGRIVNRSGDIPQRALSWFENMMCDSDYAHYSNA
jgi:hypothetical protein